jgi:hypothetical protein
MKTIGIAVLAAATALAGCTFKSTEVRRAETPPPVMYQAPAPTVVAPPAATATAPGPTIAYTVMGQSQFNQAAVQAANWCNVNHGTGARLIDRQRSTAGDIVTFACTSS